MREQEHHKKAFEFYYGLGEARNYKQVADKYEVSLGSVKAWGRKFGWRRRVGERDGEVARAMADQNIKDGVERVARNRKLVEMGLVRVAQAIAEGKVKVTVADLDRLIRLEEFLREDVEKNELKIVLWCNETDGPTEQTGDAGNARTAIPDKED